MFGDMLCIPSGLSLARPKRQCMQNNVFPHVSTCFHVLVFMYLLCLPVCKHPCILSFFMYLFMDVLINQPRNAGSSTSLTASIALGIKFFLLWLHCMSTHFTVNTGFSDSLFCTALHLHFSFLLCFSAFQPIHHGSSHARRGNPITGRVIATSDCHCKSHSEPDISGTTTSGST